MYYFKSNIRKLIIQPYVIKGNLSTIRLGSRVDKRYREPPKKRKRGGGAKIGG